MNPPIPLVMIHGLLGPIDYFLLQACLQGLEVHTPDLLGYGVRPAAHDAADITLKGQALHVADYLRTQVRQPALVLGHSVGGAVALLAASLAPECVRGVISVEGNFTLNDAFWCGKIARMDAASWRVEYDRIRSDPAAWLRASGIEPTPERVQWARLILDHQPADTVAAMARAVVDETGGPAYLASVRALLGQGMVICLLAGQTSRAGWDVPDWVAAAARHDIVLPDVGHMMMLEAPQAFCRAVRDIMRTG